MLRGRPAKVSQTMCFKQLDLPLDGVVMHCTCQDGCFPSALSCGRHCSCTLSKPHVCVHDQVEPDHKAGRNGDAIHHACGQMHSKLARMTGERGICKGAIDINLLQELFLRDRLASFDNLPQDPRLAPSAGVKLCTYHRWFGRPQNAACPSYWESPMRNAKLHRILRFRMGSHHLPVEEGRHFNLPRASRVCNLCNTDALGDERHMLLECPALAALRLQFSSLLLPCSGVMRRLLWAKDQHEVCRYIIACLDRMSSH